MKVIINNDHMFSVEKIPPRIYLPITSITLKLINMSGRWQVCFQKIY